MTTLIIVESPGKIKKIKSFLGANYNVAASVGHIRDLCKKSLSIDVNNKFEPTYEIIYDKKKVVATLKKLVSNSNKIMIASDGDREGEAIAYHLITVLKLDEYDRIVFNEITKSALLNAINSPRKVDMNMFYSQQARRLLDRLVGFTLTPILKNIPNLQKHNIGTGRVQSVVTKLIVEKENDIKSFFNANNASIFNVTGNFIINSQSLKTDYVVFDKKTLKTTHKEVTNKEQVKIIANQICKHKNFKIIHVFIKDRQCNPPQPFVTSTLQQEASYKLHLPIKQTMFIAQKLYEKGHITYMRTDSPSLSKDALNSIKTYLIKDFGESYYQYRQFKSKNENSQEAHEAIRPSHIDIPQINGGDSNELKLYELIWKRTVASQMKPALYKDQYIILGNDSDDTFECQNSKLIFDGYLKLYNDDDSQMNKFIDTDTDIVNWNSIVFKETYKAPPTRFNEPILVKRLEELSLGRPSTYSSIISKIQEHNYVKIENSEGIKKEVSIYTLVGNKLQKKIDKQIIGGDKNKLVPTQDGLLVTEFLTKNFPQILDYQFTIRMENLLDEIAEGKKVWFDVLNEFYSVLKEQISSLNIPGVLISNNKIIGKHPKYGNIQYMIARYGPVFKIMCGKKTIFVSAKNINENDENIEKKAINIIDYKLKK